MIHDEIVWIRNRRAFLIVMCALTTVFICAFLLSGVLPLVFIDTTKALSLLSVVVFLCIFIGILMTPAIRIVPSRVGFATTVIVFKGPLSRRGTVVKISEIIQIRYCASTLTLQKPLKKRLHMVDIGFGYHSNVRRLCDGPVVAQLMKTVPRDRSKLVIPMPGGKMMEQEVSDS